MADIPEGVPPVSAPSPTLPAEDASATQIQRVFRGGRARRRTMESSLDVTAPTAAPTEEAAQELSGAFETLRGMPVLGSLATASLHQVAAAVTSVEFEDGAELVARGDHNALLFCVTAGTVEKRQDDLVVGIVSAGDIFGATALMSRMHRTTSVRAVGAVGCLRLARAVVDRCLDQASVDDLEIHLKRFIAAKSDLYGQRHTKRIAFIQGTLEEEHQTSPTKTAKRYRAVAKGVIRKEFDMSSPKVGDVLAGEEIDALESRELDTPAGKTWRIMFEKGWCNVSSQKGVPLLEEITSESANDVVQRTMMEALSYGGGDDDEADATAAEGADAELGATAEGGSPGGGGRPRQRSWMPKGRHARTRSEVEQQVPWHLSPGVSRMQERGMGRGGLTRELAAACRWRTSSR
jgi:CRP-like cAMP-binding protein